MLVTYYDTVEGINLLKNKDLINTINHIQAVYNVDETTLLSILKEFSIGVSSNSDVHQMAELLEKGKNVFTISTQLECTEFHVKNTIRRSPQMQAQLDLNNAEFNFIKKYGEDLYREVKAIYPPIDFRELVGIPLPIFAKKSPAQLIALGVTESKIEENFIKLGRSMDFVAYKEKKKKEHTKEKLSDPHTHIQVLYENGDEKVTLRYLSKQFQIPYGKLCSIKRLYNWEKKNSYKPDKAIKRDDIESSTPSSHTLSTSMSSTDTGNKNTQKQQMLEGSINHKLNKITKLYINNENTLYGLSKRYKMSVLSVVSIIKANFDEYNLDHNIFKRHLIREVPELFIDAKMSIDKIVTIFDISVFEIHKILEQYIGTMPRDINKYTDELFIYNWSDFQVAFLDSELSDKELSSFLSVPVSIIQAKRKDLADETLQYFRKHKNWLTIYNKIIKDKAKTSKEKEGENKC